MMKIPLSALCAVIVSFWPVLSAAQSCTSLGELGWMLGEWKAAGGETITRESWTRASARTFDGTGETTRASSGERRTFETLLLAEMSGEIFYIAKVGHNAMPVPFKLVGCSQDGALFENRGHDFPKRLEYKRAGKDSLVVAVSDGGSNGFTIRFAREGK